MFTLFCCLFWCRALFVVRLHVMFVRLNICVACRLVFIACYLLMLRVSCRVVCCSCVVVCVYAIFIMLPFGVCYCLLLFFSLCLSSIVCYVCVVVVR